METLGPKYTSEILEPAEDGSFIGKVTEPAKGWTAYFVELTFDVGGPVPLKLTTNIRVTPDELPYADRDPAQPPSVTLRCMFPSEDAAVEVSKKAPSFFKSEMGIEELMCQQESKTCYLN